VRRGREMTDKERILMALEFLLDGIHQGIEDRDYEEEALGPEEAELIIKGETSVVVTAAEIETLIDAIENGYVRVMPIEGEPT
jgi:hypothetical protein